MNYWLLKTEPGTYGWGNLVSDKKTVWDGVRNFQARNHLKNMKVGDSLFIYHSGEEKSIIGLGKVIKEAYPDPKDKEWVVVEIGVGKKLKKPVSLSTIKATKKLANMVLVRASRLSVQPVKEDEFNAILQLSELP
jgi:predicted RNA-binding protein with PUA-like domain